MTDKITQPNNLRYLTLSMTLTVASSVLLGFFLSGYFSDSRWIHYPLHSMMESVGSISAIIISLVMLSMIKNNHLPRHYVIAACALIEMGILDGFHAVLHAGISFVWLHSLATMAGGITFSAIWLTDSRFTVTRQRRLIVTVTGMSLITGIFSVLFPQYLPQMVSNGEFSLLAKVFNFSGGLGFLIGSSYFIYHQLKNRTFQATHKNQDIVFANHSFLFGIAGLLFESSTIWDAGWWWWHTLRLAAYLVVLIYFFTLFKEQEDLLRNSEEQLSFANIHLEQRVSERTKELEKANQAKSEFLSRMSHELRTPMNAILGFSQLLEMDEALQAEQKESVTEILHAGEHLLELINEVLDLAKIEEGKLTVNIEAINLSRLVSDTVSNMEPVARQNNIQLVNNISNKIKHTVQADKLRLKQVLINLLSNAIKYNNYNGKVFIDIYTTDNNIVRISIQDTGPGIQREQQKKLFIPFERLDYKNSAVEGTGIGLSLSKKLMSLMDGTIGVESIPGQGSTFYIEFPCAG